jgi:hypothetical protein
MLVAEHDWTVRIGTGRFGMCQWNMVPGDLNRYTTLYCGGPFLTLKMRAGNLTALIFVLIATAGAFALWKRCRKEHADDHAAEPTATSSSPPSAA